jgi:hypothetical protein
LYVLSSRGIRTTVLSQDGSYRFPFTDTLAPNVEIRAIAWRNGHFETVRATAFLKRSSRQLKLELEADREAYAPGSMVRVRAAVTNAEGKRVTNAKVVFAVVDKALSGVTYLNPEDPMNMLYGYVPDGVIVERESHVEGGAGILGGAGAEKGGGGYDALMQSARRIFKDTAAFTIVSTDANGEAELVFTAPDNLTTWRIQAIGVSDMLDAGASIAEVPVTRQVFVEAVLPPRLLTSDKPVMKLRAYGSGLAADGSVTFIIDAPTLGLTRQQATGTAYLPTSVSFAVLPPGRHRIVIGVVGPGGTDSVERWIDVVDTRYAHEEYTSIPVVPGSGLPEIGSAEADIVIQGLGRSSYLPTVRGLAGGSGPRLDSRIAELVMRKALTDVFGEAENPSEPPSLAAYQDYAGGLRLLPYSGSDLELTSEVVATAPELFDTHPIAAYFWKTYDDRASSREERVQAISGLASLREPVLPVLQMTAADPDLNWRERLAVARGLVAAGDREHARSILDQLLQTAVERDAVLSLAVSTSVADIYEATADAAAVAVSLSHPKAHALRSYVETNWNRDAFPILAQVRYLRAALNAIPADDGSVSWTIGGEPEETLTLKDTPMRQLTLTADQARAFRVTRVSGPVAISLVRRVTGRPTSVPEVAVTRAYQAEHSLQAMEEGDVVRVTLKAEWQPTAQDGCYRLTDHLPGGWQPVLRWSRYQGGLAYPYSVENGEVSFVVCKYQPKPTELTYVARVVSRGTYRAEAPLLQHLEYPSVAAVGQDEQVTVR